MVPGSVHTGGFDAKPRERERRIVGFFDRTLLSDGSASTRARTRVPLPRVTPETRPCSDREAPCPGHCCTATVDTADQPEES